jgi:hypothetical protein
VIGDVFSVVVLVLQDLVDRPELQLGRAGQVAAVGSVARRFPAGAHVQLARAEQFWNLNSKIKIKNIVSSINILTNANFTVNCDFCFTLNLD